MMVRLCMKQNYAKQRKLTAVNRKHLRLPLGIAFEIFQVSNLQNNKIMMTRKFISRKNTLSRIYFNLLVSGKSSKELRDFMANLHNAF